MMYAGVALIFFLMHINSFAAMSNEHLIKESIDLSNATHIAFVNKSSSSKKIIIHSCRSEDDGETFRSLYPIKIFDFDTKKLKDLPVLASVQDHEFTIFKANTKQTHIVLSSICYEPTKLLVYDAVKNECFTGKFSNNLVRNVFWNYEDNYLLGYDHFSQEGHIIDYENGQEKDDKISMNEIGYITKCFSSEKFLFTRPNQEKKGEILYLGNAQQSQICAIKEYPIPVDEASNEYFSILPFSNSNADNFLWSYEIVDNVTQKIIALNGSKKFAYAIALHPIFPYLVTMSGKYSNIIAFWAAKTGVLLKKVSFEELKERPPHLTRNYDRLFSFSSCGKLLAIAFPSRCIVIDVSDINSIA